MAELLAEVVVEIKEVGDMVKICVIKHVPGNGTSRKTAVRVDEKETIGEVAKRLLAPPDPSGDAFPEYVNWLEIRLVRDE